jgi:HSP20 family molecular chaperone IbpA
LLVGREDRPEVEVFEEGQSLVVLAELLGVGKEDILVHVSGDILTLATNPTHPERRRYYRELVLPFPVVEEGMRWNLRNGVLELEAERLREGSKLELQSGTNRRKKP